MIPRLNEPSVTPHGPLDEALGRVVSAEEVLSKDTVVAYWPALDAYLLDGETSAWTAAQWAEHLEDPLLEHPFAAGPAGDRMAVVHLDVRLHPDDRRLNGAEWSEIAHRFARAAGFENPGDTAGCRWIAVQARPGRLDVIANLIRLDGVWQDLPTNLPERLAAEARRIEQDLRLIAPAPALGRRRLAGVVPDASTQLAGVLAQLADERSGPLAAVRALVEHTAHRAALQPGTGPDIGHRLELIAHRLHAIQQDLDATATHLTTRPGQAPAVPVVPAARAADERSP
ncbi:relaxase/mobilization nuclease [Streptomyces sp. NPDC038707]|uniref:relaxase/mobilization nuclease n=1 Tax=Streptomyces sp. NPDC038707 TaxID=3154329 RepID=UPI0033FCDEA9